MVLSRITKELEQQASNSSLRKLVSYEGLVDFASNDYLGFNNSTEFGELSQKFLFSLQEFSHGSGGSRLLTGNSKFYPFVEKELAKFFKAPAALIFNSGYSANLGLLSTILKRNDTIIYDELCHSSIRDGIRLGLAKSVKFAHNDLEDLEQKILKTEGVKFVVIESIYSMDGDLAPLKNIIDICKNHNAQLIVDEAHASGVYGDFGQGLVASQGLEKNVFARVHTFGKSFGSHGAVVLGSNKLIEYLINFSRTFIYTTSLPPINIASMLTGMELSSKSNQLREKLFDNIEYYKNCATELGVDCLESDSQIQGIIVPGNKKVSEISDYLREKGFDVRAIRSPTVPTGSERLRICLHSFNSKKEIKELLQNIKNYLNG